MLVISNLLFLKQIEKAPAHTGAFLFEGKKPGVTPLSGGI
jgi:hypothetical protein